MSNRARAAWWPTAVAGLLLVSGGGWLFRALPSSPSEQSVAPAAPSQPAATTQHDPVALPDAAGVAAAVAEKQPEVLLADTAVYFTTHDPTAYDKLAHPWREHRYVGLLGGRTIVVWLSVGDSSVSGSWYYRTGRQPHEHQLTFRRRRGGHILLAEEIKPTLPTDDDIITAEWQVRWPLGRVLAGQRRAAASAGRQAVALREDYSQAVPYELLRLTAHSNSHCDVAPNHSQQYYSSEFVRVLSADSLRLALWQAPPLAARRDSVQHWLQSESCQQTSQSIDIMLNDYDLLSYNVWRSSYYYGTHPEHDQEGFIVDRRTGEEWLVEELLRPGTERALLKLLARHLRHDYSEMTQEDRWDWKGVPPLPSSFTLTPTGLCAGYGDYALAAYVASYANTTTIPYAELRPLVRPGTPLARMLRARGLW